MKHLLFLLIGGAAVLLNGEHPDADPPPPQEQQGGARTFMLRGAKVQTVDFLLPAGFREEIPYPLLVVLHGNGGTAENFLRAFRSYRKEHMIVAAPQGQYSRLINGTIGFSWFAEAGDRSLWEFADPISVRNVMDAVDTIASTYKIRSTFILGFSQGAAIAYLAGFLYPDRCTGILAIGGGLPAIGGEGSIISRSDLEKARGVHVLIARGKDDPALGKKSFERQKEFLTAEGFPVTALEYEGGHVVTDELLLSVAEWIKERQ